MPSAKLTRGAKPGTNRLILLLSNSTLTACRPKSQGAALRPQLRDDGPRGCARILGCTPSACANNHCGRVPGQTLIRRS